MRRYLEFVRIELVQGLHDRGAALGRFGFYGVVLFVFSRLWEVVATKSSIGIEPRDMLWYLAMTELIVLGVPLTHMKIEEDVRSGDLAYALTKPVSYLWARFSREMGDLIARLVFLIPAGVFFAWIFSGGPPTHPLGFLIFLPLALLASAVAILFHTAIGLCSFWIQDSSPLYWVWQKGWFVLGGMILPLDIYPDWLRELAFWTPFASLLYEPAKAGITADPSLALACAAKLLGWLLVGVGLAMWVHNRAQRGLEINGG